MRDAPIGIFDSGVGGLTVARAVLDQLPHEPVLYVGDTARGPYGPLPLAEVRSYALDVMDHLVQEGVKALVIACNSASAAVLRDAGRVVERRNRVEELRALIGAQGTVGHHEGLNGVAQADTNAAEHASRQDKVYLLLPCIHYKLPHKFL